MTKLDNEKILIIAEYYLNNSSTIRATAKYFNLGKSTVHNYLYKSLPRINLPLYKKVSELAHFNFIQKHIRGGLATKEKFNLLSLPKF